MMKRLLVLAKRSHGKRRKNAMVSAWGLMTRRDGGCWIFEILTVKDQLGKLAPA